MSDATTTERIDPAAVQAEALIAFAGLHDGPTAEINVAYLRCVAATIIRLTGRTAELTAQLADARKDFDRCVEDSVRLARRIGELERLNVALAERVGSQSELPSRRAGKPEHAGPWPVPSADEMYREIGGEGG